MLCAPPVDGDICRGKLREACCVSGVFLGGLWEGDGLPGGGGGGGVEGLEEGKGGVESVGVCCLESGCELARSVWCLLCAVVEAVEGHARMSAEETKRNPLQVCDRVGSRPRGFHASLSFGGILHAVPRVSPVSSRSCHVVSTRLSGFGGPRPAPRDAGQV